MKRYENLEKSLCKELELLNDRYANNPREMAMEDVEKADLLYHALKSAATYHAMKDAEEWDKEESGRRGDDGRMYSGSSYRRGRDSMGRYTSRDMDGYSGHYPEWMPPYRY